MTNHEALDKYLKLRDKKKAELEELEAVIGALDAAIVRNIRSMFIPWTEKLIEKAWTQQHEKYKKDRPEYESIKGNLISWLFKSEDHKAVKIINIMPFNYDRCRWSIIFTFKGYKFNLRVPNVRAANEWNIKNMYYGKYGLWYEKSDSCWNHITDSYDLDVIGRAIYDFVDWKDESDKF